MKIKKKKIKSMSLVMTLILYGTIVSGQTISRLDPIYENLWGTLYNPDSAQCDNTPTITADGSHIDPNIASTYRWMAISQDLLDNQYRLKNFIKDSTDNRFRGKIKFGDTIWVESTNPNINGIWIVHDAMNKRYKNAVDFLQTKGDGSLYNNNKLWDGKFRLISIYKLNKSPIGNVLKVNILNTKGILRHIGKIRYAGLITHKSIKNDSVNDIKSYPRKNYDTINYKYMNLEHLIKQKKMERKKIKEDINFIKSMLHKYKKQKKLYKV
jgi:hypothetical protein